MRRHLSGRLALAIGVLTAAPQAASAQSGVWALTNALSTRSTHATSLHTASATIALNDSPPSR